MAKNMTITLTEDEITVLHEIWTRVEPPSGYEGRDAYSPAVGDWTEDRLRQAVEDRRTLPREELAEAVKFAVLNDLTSEAQQLVGAIAE